VYEAGHEVPYYRKSNQPRALEYPASYTN
jgi:hypothetical protein